MTTDNQSTDAPKDDASTAAATPDVGHAASPAHSDDPWGQAPSGQADTASASSSEPEPHAAFAEQSLFKPLTENGEASAGRDLDLILEIPVTLSVELGQTRLTIHELLDLAKGSIVELEGFAGEPMDVLVNGYLIAQGEVVVVDDKYGIRINDIVNRTERIHKLNR